MKHESKLFGAFEYNENQVITFPKGLLGFRDYTRFVVKSHARTAPVKWLLSVEEGGPEFAIVDPHLMDARCGLRKMHIGKESLAKLGARNTEELKLFAVVSTPEDIRQISMNLRAPILICPKTRRGLQRQESEIRSATVRRPIYRELTGDIAEKTNGQLVLHRKVNETIMIGDDIEIEVIAFEDGGVRLGISAPKDIRVTRGRNNVSAEAQMRTAAMDANPTALSDLLRETGVPKEAAV